VQIISSDHKFSFTQSSTYKVNLLKDYKATATLNGQSFSGTWSTIYDQAMRVELDNGVRFVTNFRYNVLDSISKDPVGDGAGAFSSIKAGSYGSFDSKCNETMVGFVQTMHGKGSLENHTVQCFYGKQTKHYDIQHSVEVLEGEGSKIAKIQGENGASNSVAQIVQDAFNNDGPADEEEIQIEADVQTSAFQRESHKRKSHKRFNAHHAHVASDENDVLINAINTLDLGWKADTCKYQKQHANYGSHCESQILA
jgi:hypothetical protein